MKLIQPFDPKSDQPPEDKSDDYLKFLDIFSELQKYLRIGESFVFFMDLSKYYFLSHIIQAFHDTEKKVYDEIKRNSEVVGDYRKFEDRYGSENIPFFLHIDRLYKQYEAELNTLIKQFDLPSTPSLEQVKTWFFIHLVGERIKRAEEGMSAEFIVGVNRLLDGIVNEDVSDIQRYRDSVRKSIHHTAFVQNKGYMEGIIANLLELLAHLHDKKVAMRDLKPDNMLVAGNKYKYPSFLAYPQEYKIGLIDVETAVILPESDKRNIDQPPLGGTPQYATPSHFVSNTLLAHLYDDLPTILHLQDWHAIVAIIYRVVTGLPLFERTARMVTGIINEMRAHRGKEQERFPAVNEAFWNSAVREFNEKVVQNQRLFKSVNVHIRDGAKKMFQEIASDERQRLADEIEQRLTSLSIPMSAKDRQLLISSSHQKIKSFRKKWESKASGQKRQIDVPQIILLLRDLEGLKFQLELQTQMLQLLDQPLASASARTILEFMSNMVSNRMHGMHWGYIPSQNSLELADFASSIGESSSQTTIAVTSET
ncbi:MAG: hypothetical protein LJE88_16125 [Deltaproteobacteria bacterium]|nr:hypothetical protein [Deltaproteobacteria bacterium]